MFIPSGRLGKFAKEVIDAASGDLVHRIQVGATYRNLYLSGSAEGEMQTYPLLNQLIDDEASFMYSPVEMRFAMGYAGPSSVADIRKARAASADLHTRFRRRHVDTQVSQAVKWSLIKGKTFLKLLWTEDGFSPLLVQPEYMGVLQPELGTLDQQDAFFQSTYMTQWGFARLIERHPQKADLEKAARKYLAPGQGEQPGSQTWLKTVILGGMNPYKAAGSASANPNKGLVNWMDSPRPTLSPNIIAEMLRVDELWVWNDKLDDYTTIQVLGDIVISGQDRFTNIFADDMHVTKDGDNPKDKSNPLLGKHPYVEFCSNPIPDYFWGDSEVRVLGPGQQMLNKSVDGINHLLRVQEKPPRSFHGIAGMTSQKASVLNKPGGTLSDANPNWKIEKHAPEIPQGLYQRVHESVGIMHEMAGMKAVLRGEGESGVRSQGHADALSRNASPNFKDRAILIERSVEEVGGLGFDIARAKITDPLLCWLKPGEESIEATPDNVIPYEAPAKGMKPIDFKYRDVNDKMVLTIDSHSASPIFRHEMKAEIFDLVKIGAITPYQAVERLHPQGEDEILTDLDRREIQQAEMFAKLPPEEQARVMAAKGKGRR